MDSTTNYYTDEKELPRDIHPLMKDVPTPDAIILDMLPVFSEYKDLVKNIDEFEVNLQEIISNVFPYLIEDDKADAGLSTYVSLSYDIFIEAYKNKRNNNPPGTVYQEIDITQQAYDNSMAIEIVGTQLLSLMRMHRMYYGNRAFYQFSKMQDKYSACFTKSDVHFFPF